MLAGAHTKGGGGDARLYGYIPEGSTSATLPPPLHSWPIPCRCTIGSCASQGSGNNIITCEIQRGGPGLPDPLPRINSVPSTAFASSSSQLPLQPQCLLRTLLLLFRPDAVVRAFWCHQKALRQPDRHFLRDAALLLRHPRVYPQQQMLFEKPCALFRQSVCPFVPTLIATFCPYLSRI